VSDAQAAAEERMAFSQPVAHQAPGVCPVEPIRRVRQRRRYVARDRGFPSAAPVISRPKSWQPPLPRHQSRCHDVDMLFATRRPRPSVARVSVRATIARVTLWSRRIGGSAALMLSLGCSPWSGFGYGSSSTHPDTALPSSAASPSPSTSSPVSSTQGAIDPSSSTCSFGDCQEQGWVTRQADGTSSDTRCSFGSCQEHGWSARQSDGTSSDTRCSFGNCEEHGWSTRHSDGASSDTQCSFGACKEHGWSTRNSDGTSSDTRCKFGDCDQHGWTTRHSDGTTIDCTCKFGNCNDNGVDCR
jgi:hypothetical protein